MNGNTTDRLSQKSERRDEKVNSILEDAAEIARRVLSSIQALAGTTACKGVQIARLKEWALNNAIWIDDISQLGTFSDRGSENEVYINNETQIVYKLNDFRYSDDNLMPFFERIRIHNRLFEDCQYEMIGMAENQSGKPCAVLTQPYILAEREATEKEISEELLRLGFHPEMEGEYFSNGYFDIFDASPNNVLMGIDGHLYFIDTIIYKSDTGGFDTYRSLSPNYSPKTFGNLNENP